IIHTHLLASDIMGRVAGFLTGRPVVSTVHNVRDDFDQEPLRRRLMERWTGRLMCSRIVVVSELLRRELAEWYGIPPGRLVAIPNGVDTESFRREPEFDRTAVKRALVGGDYPLVTNVARLVAQKGQSYLIQAAR